VEGEGDRTVCHRQHTGLVVRVLEVLIREALAVDGLTTSAIPLGEVPALQHKPLMYRAIRVNKKVLLGLLEFDFLRRILERHKYDVTLLVHCCFTVVTLMSHTLMTRWNALPLKHKGLPSVPIPFSPVHSACHSVVTVLLECCYRVVTVLS
jgi:hypothetical protein